MKRFRIALLLLSLLGIAGCSPFIVQEQPVHSESRVILETGHSVGQTFVAREDGLEGVQIFFAPTEQGTGEIRLRLRADSQSNQDLATASIPVQSVNSARDYRFVFPSQSHSSGQAYYLLLDLQGDGRVKTGTAPGEHYLEGALYRDGSPIDAQMSFHLVYNRAQMIAGWLNEAQSWLGILGITIFLFIIPGLALLKLWTGFDTLGWGERVGLAAGTSLALYPLSILWTNLFNLRLGALYAWLPGLAGLAFLIWKYRRWRFSGQFARGWLRSDSFWHDASLLIVIALIAGTRVWFIRSLDAPMWGDSYQHTMIVQLIVDNAGLFDSWKPYADLLTFTYHFGFHADAAAVHWISGMEMPQSILWTGQILNALAALALYPLAVRVANNRWAGVAAVLVAGLLSSMPMYYSNWGRYTQLAGQVILPAAIWIAWTALDATRRDWRLIIFSWIAIAGLALTHYRVLIFAVSFFIAYLALNFRQRQMRARLERAFLIAVGAGFLFLPWFVHTFAGKIMLITGTQLSTPAAATPDFIQEYNAVGDLSLFLPNLLWVLLLLSILWGILRREKSILVICIWWAVILVAANPQWLRLPGQGVLTNFTVFIAAYIPASVLIGSALGWLVSQLEPKTKLFSKSFALTNIVLFLGIAAIALWGARERLRDLREAQHALVTRPDLQAMNWIRENTPSDARFLVNSFFAYGGSSIVGSDAGWWLPLLARRATMLPPLNYVAEQGPRVDYREWVNGFVAEIQKQDLACPEMAPLLQERGITHVYIGQRQGRVNYDGSTVLQPNQLAASPCFRVIYHQDRVWVFQTKASQ